MDQLTLRLILLSHCRGIGRRAVWQMMKADPGLQHLYHYTPVDLQRRFRISAAAAGQFLEDRRAIDPLRLSESYRSEGITVIPFHHAVYPDLLKNIYDPPYIIYARGNSSFLKHKKTLSVVGTRRPGSEAGRVLSYILPPLIREGWTIISGMAVGIDGMAHRLALTGHTIAVLGSGLNKPYPAQHDALYRELCRSHLVISEYPPSAPPARWRFPERNRIISGLSLGTLIVEAKERSGSLITADQALEQGREVFAIPGSILSDTSTGTNRLIQQGAKLVSSWRDIADEFAGR